MTTGLAPASPPRRAAPLVALLASCVLAWSCSQPAGEGSAPGRSAGAEAAGRVVGAAAPAEERPDPAGPLRRPHVIVILVDTLRADALGYAGYSRDTSPRLDRWAARGFVFEEATTPAGWTRPAVVSLFTGLYPATHGVQDKEHVGPGELLMLAEVFSGAGYETAAFVTNFAVDRQFGCMQGFEHYRWFDKAVDSGPTAPKALNYVPAGDIDAEIRAFLSAPRERPLFAYIHTTDPHYPYLPPPRYLQWGTDSRARYDGEVLYTDDVVGGWLDLLASTGMLQESIVVFTADHGEEFHEHGATGHGITVFQECARVPLVVWGPGIRPGRSDALVSLADLPPTLVELAGVPAPPGFARQGRSFRSLLTGGPAAGWSWAYSELVYPSKGITFAYRQGGERVVHIVRDKVGRRQWTGLFDVRRDPLEQANLIDARTSRAQELVKTLNSVRDEHLATAIGSRAEPLDEDARERMRALGYVD